MNILICDDNEVYLRNNKELIEEIAQEQEVEIRVFSFLHTGREYQKCIRRMRIDIALLDIQLGTDDGIKLVGRLREYSPHISVIFITEFSSYATEACRKMPFGFLEKPVQKGMLKNLFVKAVDQCRGIQTKEESNSIKFYFEKETVVLKESDILYITKEGRSVQIVTPEEKYLFYGTLKNIEGQLTSRFMKACNGVIINKNKVREITKDSIFIEDGTRLPIAQKRYLKVIEEYRRYNCP